MTSLSKEILEKYQVRKTRKQKTEFINFLKEKIEGVKIEEGGLFRSKNIVVGDEESAKVVFGAHYDTCTRLFFPNFLTPKNLILYLLYNLLITFGLFFLCTVVLIVAYIVTRNIDFAGWLFTATMWVILFLMMFGPANKHNANDNTSGVIMLCELIEGLTEEQRKNVAFVFFDHEESGLFGSALFSRTYKKQMKDKLFVNFDCISDGDNIMIIRNKKARRIYNKAIEEAFFGNETKNIILDNAVNVIYPSDQVNFPCYIAVAAFKKNKLFGLYINKIHTRKDVNFDEKNIEIIRDGSSKLIKKIMESCV